MKQRDPNHMTPKEWGATYTACGEILADAPLGAVAAFFIATADETARALLG